jgi:hypothetical protein
MSTKVRGVGLVELMGAVTGAPTQSGVELEDTCAHDVAYAAPVNVTVPVGRLSS